MKARALCRVGASSGRDEIVRSSHPYHPYKAEEMERIGEYLVRRLVGEGGMGKVYEAEERLSHRRVALKVLRPELGRSEEGRQLFMNEMTILAHLDHPHVVRCLSCSEVDGRLVMALEYLEGRTLRRLLIEQGALGWDEAVALATQIASALGAAHRQDPQIVHRDLKPENVMIDEDGSVKVMDFGIAKVLQAVSKATSQSVGTLAYMSPEQIEAAGVDGRSDLYCLGLLLYEMIAGKAPFASASPRELLNMQCTQAPPRLPDAARRGLPKGVERLIFELLEKSPDDRPAAAEDVLHKLEPFAPAASAPPRSSRRAAEPEHANERADTEPNSVRDPAPAAPPARGDTTALVDRVSAPCEVSRRTGVAIVVALSVLAGGASYFVRVHYSGRGTVQESPRLRSPAPAVRNEK